MHSLLLWLAMQATAAEKQVCLPAPTGKQWVCMPPAEVAAWKAAHPIPLPARKPARPVNKPATTPNTRKLYSPAGTAGGSTAAAPTGTASFAAPVIRQPHAAPAPTRPASARNLATRNPQLDQDAAIRLLYKAPATLPGQGGRLRRAPTTLEELQGKPVPQKRAAANMSHEPPETEQATPRPPEQQKAQATTKPVHTWQVRLLGSARADKLASLRQSLPESLQDCRVYSKPLGELPWQELRCGQFHTRSEAQQWIEKNRKAFPAGSLPTAVKTLP